MNSVHKSISSLWKGITKELLKTITNWLNPIHHFFIVVKITKDINILKWFTPKAGIHHILAEKFKKMFSFL
jgi:hypothetical protein